jgi:hypothetical protein
MAPNPHGPDPQRQNPHTEYRRVLHPAKGNPPVKSEERFLGCAQGKRNDGGGGGGGRQGKGAARGSEDIHGSGGEEGNDGQGDQGLEHHAQFCPAREDRGIGRGESRAGIEGQEEVVHEMR